MCAQGPCGPWRLGEIGNRRGRGRRGRRRRGEGKDGRTRRFIEPFIVGIRHGRIRRVRRILPALWGGKSHHCRHTQHQNACGKRDIISPGPEKGRCLSLKRCESLSEFLHVTTPPSFYRKSARTPAAAGRSLHPVVLPVFRFFNLFSHCAADGARASVL